MQLCTAAGRHVVHVSTAGPKSTIRQKSLPCACSDGACSSFHHVTQLLKAPARSSRQRSLMLCRRFEGLCSLIDLNVLVSLPDPLTASRRLVECGMPGSLFDGPARQRALQDLAVDWPSRSAKLEDLHATVRNVCAARVKGGFLRAFPQMLLRYCFPGSPLHIRHCPGQSDRCRKPDCWRMHGCQVPQCQACPAHR